MPKRVKKSSVSKKVDSKSMPAKVSEKKSDDSKLFAFLAILLSIVGFIIAYVVKKDDKYVMFYAKQSLVLFIAYVIAGVIGLLPIIGLIGWVLEVGLIVLGIIGIVYSFSGEMKDIPIIGQFAKKINF